MGFFGFSEKKNSSSIAKERLKLVLSHERAMLSPQMLEELKKELVTVISKYIDIDDDFNIEIAQETEANKERSLIANIPLKNKK